MNRNSIPTEFELWCVSCMMVFIMAVLIGLSGSLLYIIVMWVFANG